MDDNTKLALEVEASKGEQYQRAYDQLVTPFFEAKQAELFEAFQDAPTTETDILVTLKLQSNALKSLDEEFKHYINTGKLARQQLETEADTEEKDDE